ALLRKARYDACAGEGKVIARAPGYRSDIMHPADIAEDVAIAYDLNRMDPEPPSINTIGGISRTEAYSAPVREVMVGLGYQEVLTLTNKENLFERMNLPPGEVCEIANPISASWTAIRSWLLPSLMEFLTHNLHNEFPQKVFEVGDVSVLDESQETRTRTVRKLACARSDTRVSYEDASSDLDAILRLMDVPYELRAGDLPFFIPGRGAEVVVRGRSVGFLGEVHPLVINNWGLEKPVVAFELDLDGVFQQ
ncbi:MAG: phenylalanine--tRNA ligase subunit beta, partial [Acidobacteria bacterium]|nr:phenylalanine--tRNA ligase subunit beta [Acidobacteriota bacterium]